MRGGAGRFATINPAALDPSFPSGLPSRTGASHSRPIAGLRDNPVGMNATGLPVSTLLLPSADISPRSTLPKLPGNRPDIQRHRIPDANVKIGVGGLRGGATVAAASRFEPIPASASRADHVANRGRVLRRTGAVHSLRIRFPTLIGHKASERSILGLIVAALSVIVMPLLARAKRLEAWHRKRSHDRRIPNGPISAPVYQPSCSSVSC